MAFLFKSKKNQDRGLSSREGPPPSGPGSLGGGAVRVARDEKSSLQRSTPPGSLNSIDNDGSAGSPDQALGFARRATGLGEQGPSQPAADAQVSRAHQEPARRPGPPSFPARS